LEQNLKDKNKKDVSMYIKGCAFFPAKYFKSKVNFYYIEIHEQNGTKPGIILRISFLQLIEG